MKTKPRASALFAALAWCASASLLVYAAENMETVPPIVTRGVLVDVAAYKGVERLRKGYVITPADLEGALKRQGVGIRAGDAVLFHTGWGGLWGKDNQAAVIAPAAIY